MLKAAAILTEHANRANVCVCVWGGLRGTRVGTDLGVAENFLSWGRKKEMRLQLAMLSNQGPRKKTQSDSDGHLGISKHTKLEYKNKVF